jgi:biopolymer transport protein ExbB
MLAVALCLALAGPTGWAQESDSAGTTAAPPPPTSQPDAGGNGGSRKTENPLIDFLFFSITGWILIGIYVVFIAMLVWLFLDLRGAIMIPIDFLETFEDALSKRRFREAFEMAKADGSMLGRVMTAGMTRLQHGLQEGRDAAWAMIDSLKARKDHVIAYLAIIGTLGPLIGLVGTVSGMIESFGELGRGSSPNPARLADGISHALNATLVGIFLACLAIPSYSFFRNRLARITNDVSLMTDDLLTQMYYSSRRSTDAGTAPPKSVPPSTASVPTKPTEA